MARPSAGRCRSWRVNQACADTLSVLGHVPGAERFVILAAVVAVGGYHSAVAIHADKAATNIAPHWPITFHVDILKC